MNQTENTSESFDERQSIQVIKEMIQVSQSKLRNDGILFILWGWILFINYFFLNYLTSALNASNQLMQIVRILRVTLPLVGIIFTFYYIWQQRKKVQTYIGISLRYIWISLLVCLVLINLIQFNVLQSINFELQHPIFMVLFAFAITITGGILRYKLVIYGGITFAFLAFVASYLGLKEQLLVESIAWLVAFIIPGHFMYSQRNKK